LIKILKKALMRTWQWVLQRSESLLVNTTSSIGKSPKGQLPIDALSGADLEWAVGSVCNLNATPFELSLFRERFAPPHHLGSLIDALEALGFKPRYEEAQGLNGLHAHLPLLVTLNPQADAPGDVRTPPTLLEAPRLGILARIEQERVVLFVAGSNTPQILSITEFLGLFRGQVIHFEKAEPVATDPDGQARTPKFGFGWFVPELLKHRSVWRDVIVASLLMQLIALAMPLASQVIMDKVIVHRTLNTLWVVAAALAICIVFTGIMTWVRQYLINHTGNRVDATLGAAVFHRLVSLPVRYFEQRPTGVIAARLHGVDVGIRLIGVVPGQHIVATTIIGFVPVDRQPWCHRAIGRELFVARDLEEDIIFAIEVKRGERSRRGNEDEPPHRQPRTGRWRNCGADLVHQPGQQLAIGGQLLDEAEHDPVAAGLDRANDGGDIGVVGAVHREFAAIGGVADPAFDKLRWQVDAGFCQGFEREQRMVRQAMLQHGR
jgi:hypothetical protein